MSRKSKGIKSIEKKSLEKINSRLKEHEFSRKTELVGNKPSGEKMSEVVLRFVAPYVGTANMEERFESLLLIAVVAWNTSLFPAEERETALQNLLGETSELFPEEAYHYINEMIARKDKYFS